ncbi:hypothetical protein LTS17_005396 [Exophiala oligosperma]
MSPSSSRRDEAFELIRKFSFQVDLFVLIIHQPEVPRKIEAVEFPDTEPRPKELERIKRVAVLDIIMLESRPLQKFDERDAGAWEQGQRLILSPLFEPTVARGAPGRTRQVQVEMFLESFHDLVLGLYALDVVLLHLVNYLQNVLHRGVEDG